VGKIAEKVIVIGTAAAGDFCPPNASMLDWFRAQGRGYQTKINAILRSYFEHNSR
jgi:hypothetical protein